MNRPQSWKNLMAASMEFIWKSTGETGREKEWGNSVGDRGCRVGRLGGVRLFERLVAHLAPEHVAIDRRERLVDHAHRRPAGEVARQRLLPGHDVEHLGQFAVADD